MLPDLAIALNRLEADLRVGVLDRSALFWFRSFVVSAAAGDGVVRSDRWVEDGLVSARAVPGLSAAELAPRQRLVSDYGLFRFVRLKDNAEFSGDALAALDWQRKYRVSLMPAYLPDLHALQTWTDALWAELGGVDPRAVALEQVLKRYLGTPSPALPRGGVTLPSRQGVTPNSYLLEILHEAQTIYHGWLPRPLWSASRRRRLASRRGVRGHRVLRDVSHPSRGPKGDPCVPGWPLRCGRRRCGVGRVVPALGCSAR